MGIDDSFYLTPEHSVNHSAYAAGAQTLAPIEGALSATLNVSRTLSPSKTMDMTVPYGALDGSAVLPVELYTPRGGGSSSSAEHQRVFTRLQREVDELNASIAANMISVSGILMEASVDVTAAALPRAGSAYHGSAFAGTSDTSLEHALTTAHPELRAQLLALPSHVRTQLLNPMFLSELAALARAASREPSPAVAAAAPAPAPPPAARRASRAPAAASRRDRRSAAARAQRDERDADAGCTGNGACTLL